MKGVVLYLDDVEALRAALAESEGEVEIQTEDAELESVDELRRLPRVRELELSRKEPRVTVFFRAWGTRVWCWDDADVLSRALSTDVRSILGNCKKRWWASHAMASLTNALLLVVLVIGGALMVAAAAEVFSVADEFLLAGPIAIGVSFALLMFLVYRNDHFGFKLIPHYRHEHTTFWSRNKDKILLALLLGIPSNVAVGLIVYFLTRD